MNHQETVRAVARKLRQFTRRDVSEMLDVLIEVWSDELREPEGFVRLDGLGKLYVEQQTIAVNGAIQQVLERKQSASRTLPTTMNHYYFRFLPTDILHQKGVRHQQKWDTE
jgi:hypothetical protein